MPVPGEISGVAESNVMDPVMGPIPRLPGEACSTLGTSSTDPVNKNVMSAAFDGSANPSREHIAIAGRNKPMIDDFLFVLMITSS